MKRPPFHPDGPHELDAETPADTDHHLNAENCRYAGWAYQHRLGDVVRSDHELAIRYYTIGCDTGSAHSCYLRADIDPDFRPEGYVRACQAGLATGCAAAGPPWDGTGDVPPPQWPRVGEAIDAIEERYGHWGPGNDFGPDDEEEEP